MDERKLIEQAAGGDQEAFCELYDLYRDRLYRYSFYKTGDSAAAEDAVSECVIAAWKGIGALRDPSAFKTWIYRILQTCCAKHWKVRIQERENLEQLYRENGHLSQDPTLSVELSEALIQLDPEEQDIVLLSAVLGMKSREIGQMYGLTPGGVRSKLSRALKKMKFFLEVR